MKPVVYDAGALIAADRNDRRMWAEHRVRLELGFAPVVPAAVVAQVSRSPKQVQLRRLLAGCEVVPFNENDAHEVGHLLALSMVRREAAIACSSKTKDVIDASVVHLAVRRRGDIVTSDAGDLLKLTMTHRPKPHLFDI